MSKAETEAAIAASVKKSNADAAAVGNPEFVGAMMRAGVEALSPTPSFTPRGSAHAQLMVNAMLGKKRHRRGWCSL